MIVANKLMKLWHENSLDTADELSVMIIIIITLVKRALLCARSFFGNYIEICPPGVTSTTIATLSYIEESATQAAT